MATKQPSSQSELELFRVLQRANLLQYYDTFIAQGGDDVQQLCEAGEEEFLEIMALVGMASKPLHVRRLQKALQEWAANPAIFQQPLEQVTSTTVAAGSILASLQQGISYSPPHSAAAASVTSWSPQPAAPAVETLATLPQSSQMQTSIGLATSGAGGGSIGGNKEEAVRVPVKQEEEVNVQRGTPSPPSLPHIPDALLKRSPSPASSNISSRADCTSPGPPPNLTEAQIQSIAEIAAKMARTLPPLEPKPMNLKKQHSKEIMEVMMMTNEDGDRLEKLRLYGAIYGRFDSKRKNVLKPMSLHEISVNEAAAQLCLHCPALLTRREELFPLARHIVKESGYRYAKGHSRAHSLEDMAAKRAKLDSSLSNITSALSCSPKNHMERTQRQTRQSEITVEISAITTKLEILKAAVNQAKNTEDVASLQKLQLEMDSLTATQLHLVAEQNQLNQSKRRNKVGRPRKLSPDRKPMEDDNGTDSSDFPSTASSPNHSTDLDMELLKETLSKIPPKHSTTEARQVIQDTLFDEGLRIAQQYGMADFAEELQGLKYVTCDDSNDADSVKTIKDNGTENSKEAGNEDTGLKSNNRDNGDHGNKSNSMIVIEPKVANGDSS